MQAYGMFGFLRSLPFNLRGSNALEIEDACLDFTENFLDAKIRISHVVNPSSVRDTSIFSVRVLDTSGQLVA